MKTKNLWSLAAGLAPLATLFTAGVLLFYFTGRTTEAARAFDFEKDNRGSLSPYVVGRASHYLPDWNTSTEFFIINPTAEPLVVVPLFYGMDGQFLTCSQAFPIAANGAFSFAQSEAVPGVSNWVAKFLSLVPDSGAPGTPKRGIVGYSRTRPPFR